MLFYKMETREEEEEAKRKEKREENRGKTPICWQGGFQIPLFSPFPKETRGENGKTPLISEIEISSPRERKQRCVCVCVRKRESVRKRERV